MLSTSNLIEPNPSFYASGFGLFAKSLKAPLPLTKLDISVDIFESTAKVIFSQTYQNFTESLLETEYFFPIPSKARFDAFHAKYEDRTIDSIIKEKKMAQEEYKQNIKKGNTAAYAEILEETPDIMKVQVGNIKPSTSIEITFSYIQRLEIIRNRFYRFVFYATLGPRYQSKSEQKGGTKKPHSTEKDIQAVLSDYPVIKPKAGSYPWSIRVNVKCNSPITYLECQSHKVARSQKGSNPCESTLSLEPTTDFQSVFNKNFDLLLSYENINRPTYRLAKNETGFCAMIDFLPRYDSEPLEDAIKAIMAAQENSNKPAPPDDVNLMTVTGEYIFLIDRSGSMDGQRISMAKEALLFALKSLPPNSFFNIYSFGDSFTTLFSKSVASSKQNVDSAIKKVQSFAADMGGTEIYPAIQTILHEKRLRQHPRTLFLLTDGEITDPNKVIKLIQSNNHCARVFALGIGNGCSEYLIKGCAEAGKGKSSFVHNPKQISENVIHLMEAAFSPVCDDFDLEFSNKEVVKMLAPEPHSLSYILRDQKVTFYVFLSNEAAENDKGFTVILKYFDTYKGEEKTSPINLNLKEYETTLDLFKLGVGEAADILEKKRRNLGTESEHQNNPDVYCAMVKEADSELLRLSIENQVLTKRTAFICVVKENSEDEIRGLKKEQVLVPQIQSNDCQKDEEEEDEEMEDEEIEDEAMEDEEEEEDAYCFSDRAPMMRGAKKGRLATISGKKGRLATISGKKGRGGMGRLLEEEEEDTHYARKMATRDPKVGCGSGGRGGLRASYSLERKRFSASIPRKKVKKSSNDDFQRNALALERFAENKMMKSSTEGAFGTTFDKSFLDIIQSQNPLGYWDLEPKYLQTIGVTQKDLLAKMPQVVKDTKGNIEQIAITIAILRWIEKYFKTHKSTWTVIHKKGVQWLKSIGFDYSKLTTEIRFI